MARGGSRAPTGLDYPRGFDVDGPTPAFPGLVAAGLPPRLPMSQFKSEQRRIRHHGRDFHFVAYEGRLANDRRGETELPAMWFLMNEGKRTAVLPHELGQPPESIDAQLVGWLDDNVFTVGATQVVGPSLPTAEKPHSWRRSRVRGGSEE